MNCTQPLDEKRYTAAEVPGDRFPLAIVLVLLATMFMLEGLTATWTPARSAGRSPRLEGVQSDGPAKDETLAVDNMIWSRQRRSFASWLLVAYAASTIAVDCFTDGIWYCAQLEGVIGDAIVEPAIIEV